MRFSVKSADHTADNAPVGWFPDPHVPGVLRYYDGMRWTEHTLAEPTVQTPARIPTQASVSAEYFWRATGNVPA